MDNGYTAKFHIIHPSIIDLYVNALTLHILQEQLSEVEPEDFTKDLQLEIDKASNEYILSVKVAEDLFGDPEIVQDQLDAFTSQREGDA